MKKSGAFLAVKALEALGVRFTFGIPGTHTTELYDELHNSRQIEPILVTHEGGAAFMADAVSRTSGSIGVLTIVPAAGLSHAMSGIAEAYLDGIPMLVISGGCRRDSGRSYQLHQIDMAKMTVGVTKKYYLVREHRDIMPTIFDAYREATSGEPGPVFVEIPVELLLFQGEVPELPDFVPFREKAPLDAGSICSVADMLLQARHPALYVGWGAMDASASTRRIAEMFQTPVATTLQGKSAFPSDHPLHVGVGFGPTGLPAAQKTFRNCDCLLAVGVRFAEVATGSYGIEVPDNLIHVDINPEVFHKNYPAKLTITGDSSEVLAALVAELESRIAQKKSDLPNHASDILAAKQKYRATWTDKLQPDRVSPGHFFSHLRTAMADDAILVLDDGNHTFLAAELFDAVRPRTFLSPTDFNCMGYCVPAAIGAKLANPDRQVAGVVGDGAFLMTGLEIVTAAHYGLGVPFFVFHDGELGQIAQFQQTPLNRKTCSVLGKFNFEGVAIATGAEFLSMENDAQIEPVIAQAFDISRNGKPVIVDVNIDYSHKTLLTKGVVRTNLSRFPLSEKIRFITRAVKRHLFEKQ
jgi:acetolactate synthase-1/2/3 large subunit